MYPIVNAHVGQRVTRFGNARIGTVAYVDNQWVGVQWDGADDVNVYIAAHLAALIPDNDDGYFDGPAGYIAAT